jgi:hypothetical protein
LGDFLFSKLSAKLFIVIEEVGVVFRCGNGILDDLLDNVEEFSAVVVGKFVDIGEG